MQELRTPTLEAQEDVFFGQLVLIVARWFLIAGATVSMVWTVADPGQLAMVILPVVALIAMNFFLHGRYLMEQPANQQLIIAASLLDLVLITAMVLVGAGEKGFGSPFLAFYYVAVLAFGFVVPRKLEIGYTTLAIGSYLLASFLANPGFLGDVTDVKTLVLRIITLAATGGLANYYWRIQRARRRAVAAA